MANNKPWTHVWVINKMDHEYKEMFKGNTITLAAGAKIKMDRYDAAAFLGQYAGDKVEKNLDIEPIIEIVEKSDLVFRSDIDGKTFKSQAELDDHLEKLRKKLGITR